MIMSYTAAAASVVSNDIPPGARNIGIDLPVVRKVVEQYRGLLSVFEGMTSSPEYGGYANLGLEVLTPHSKLMTFLDFQSGSVVYGTEEAERRIKGELIFVCDKITRILNAIPEKKGGIIPKNLLLMKQAWEALIGNTDPVSGSDDRYSRLIEHDKASPPLTSDELASIGSLLTDFVTILGTVQGLLEEVKPAVPTERFLTAQSSLIKIIGVLQSVSLSSEGFPSETRDSFLLNFMFLPTVCGKVVTVVDDFLRQHQEHERVVKELKKIRIRINLIMTAMREDATAKTSTTTSPSQTTLRGIAEESTAITSLSPTTTILVNEEATARKAGRKKKGSKKKRSKGRKAALPQRMVSNDAESVGDDDEEEEEMDDELSLIHI